jgi:TolB protein
MRRLTVGLPTALLALAVLASAPVAATPQGTNGVIAFHRYLNAEQTRAAIYTINPDGSGEQQLTQPTKGVIHARPDWSADGQSIVYVRALVDQLHPHPGADPYARIWKMHADGSRQRRVSNECGRVSGCEVEDDPAWSPDRRWIAFTRLYEKGVERGAEIVLMRSNGTHVHRVTNHPTGSLSDWEVQWSPSGDRLVFQRFSDHHHGSSALITIRPDGTGRHRLTPWMGVQYPDWSPDGRRILFGVDVDPAELWSVRPNGDKLHELKKVGTRWFSGSFSPDGTLIAWSRYGGAGDAGYPDLFVMNSDGSNVQNITDSYRWESGPDWGAIPP